MTATAPRVVYDCNIYFAKAHGMSRSELVARGVKSVIGSAA